MPQERQEQGARSGHTSGSPRTRQKQSGDGTEHSRRLRTAETPAGSTGWPLRVHKERETGERAAAAHASLAEHMDRVRPGWRRRIRKASGQDASQLSESTELVPAIAEPT